MSDNTTDSSNNHLFVKNAVEASIRIGLIFILVSWSYQIMKPFIVPVLWGTIIAVAAAPLVLRLENIFGGRRTLAATLFTLISLTLLIIPTVMLSGSMIENLQGIAHALEDGKLAIPTPPDSVATIPVIGEELDAIWFLASVNLKAAIAQFAPQIKTIGGTLLAAAGSGVSSVLQFVVSLIIAGIFLANTEGSVKASHSIAKRVIGDKGPEWAELSAATIRSVVQGVLGIALIQATLASIGLYAIGMPAPGLFTLLVLFVAIIQLPPLLILGPVAAYVFSYADTTPAVIFMVWSVLVSMSDAFLKPLLLGRGVDIPMLVILLGAIGGMIMSGIIGLFVGAVVLALGYKLFTAWINDNPMLEDKSALNKNPYKSWKK